MEMTLEMAFSSAAGKYPSDFISSVSVLMQGIPFKGAGPPEVQAPPLTPTLN